MKTLWIHISPLSILLPLLSASQSSELNHSSTFVHSRGVFCGSTFRWNGDMKQVKLLNDCDITKDQFTLEGSVGRITHKTECITFIDLLIDGVDMRWKNVDGSPFITVTFENLLHEQNRHRQARIMVTARNPNAQPMDFRINFDIDSSNCSRLVKGAIVNLSNTTDKGETGGLSAGYFLNLSAMAIGYLCKTIAI